jgi:hypothetical protein
VRTYSKISPLYWIGELSEALAGDPVTHTVAHYLMTCPACNMVGLYNLRARQISADTGIPLHSAGAGFDWLAPGAAASVNAALQRLEELGFVKVDAQLGIVWVVKYAGHDTPVAVSPNSPGDKRPAQVKKVLSGINQASPLYAEFLEAWGAHFCLKIEGVAKNSEGVAQKPVRGCQENGKGLRRGSEPLPPKRHSPDPDPEPDPKPEEEEPENTPSSTSPSRRVNGHDATARAAPADSQEILFDLPKAQEPVKAKAKEPKAAKVKKPPAGEPFGLRKVWAAYPRQIMWPYFEKAAKAAVKRGTWPTNDQELEDMIKAMEPLRSRMVTYIPYPGRWVENDAWTDLEQGNPNHYPDSSAPDPADDDIPF